MKKVLCVILTLIFVFALSACGGNDEVLPNEETVATTETQPVSVSKNSSDDFSGEYIFASGAGAWGNVLNLNSDGSFEGVFHDTDMQSSSDEQPYNAFSYDCKYSGKFEIEKGDNDYTYYLTMTEFVTEKPIGEEWAEGAIKYIITQPRGIEDCKEFVLYTPDAPVDELPEEFLRWCSALKPLDENTSKTLTCYGIMNTESEIGFFRYD